MAEITYTDKMGVQVPNIAIPEPPKIGKYGTMRLHYLMEQKHGTYMTMLENNTLNQHLEQIDQQAKELLENQIEIMQKNQGVTEELKAQNQMLWVQKMSVT